MAIINKASRYEEQGYTLYSRYNATTGEVTFKDTVTARRYTSWSSAGNRIHTTIQGETYRSLSRMYYGREDFWWILADVNVGIDLFKGSFGLDAGTLIEVPPRSFLP